MPTELILKPGDKVNFRVKLFDAQGNFIREEPAAQWSLDQLKGDIANGQFTAGGDKRPGRVGKSNGEWYYWFGECARVPAIAVERKLRRDGGKLGARQRGTT